MVLVKGALQKPRFDNITANPTLVFDNDRSHISRPDFFQHSVQPRTLESRSPHSVIGEVPDIRKAVLLGVVLQNALLRRDLSRWFSAKGYQKSNGAATRHLYGSPSTI